MASRLPFRLRRRPLFLLASLGAAIGVIACSGASRTSAPEASSSSASPLVSAVFDVGDRAARGTFDAAYGHVACDGAGHALVAWSRISDGRLFFARVDRATGAALDPDGVDLGAGIYGAPPLVAFDGARYRIAWTDSSGAHAARLALDGTRDGDVPIPGASPTGASLACGADGTCLVAWPAGYGVSYARLGADGALLDAKPPTIPWSDYTTNVRAVRDAAGYHLLFTANHELGTSSSTAVTQLMQVHLDAAGGVVAGPSVLVSPSISALNVGAIALATNGSELLASWGQASQIWGQRLALDGTAIDAAPVAYVAASYGGPLIAAAGSTFAVVASASAGAQVFRVGGDGKLVDPKPVPFGTGGSPLDVASDGGSFFAVANEAALTGYAIPMSGAPSPAQPLLQAHAQQTSVALAWGGASYMATWVDDRRGSYLADLYGARVSADGARLDATAILLGTATRPLASPALSPVGAGYLLAYVEGSSLAIRPLGADGQPTGAAVTIASEAVSPRVASRGADALVAWVDSTTDHVRYRRVGADGAPLDAAWNLPASVPSMAGLAWTGASYLVAWVDQKDLYGVWVGPTGAYVSTPASLTSGLTVDDAGDPGVLGASVACGAGVCLAAWSTPDGVAWRRFDARGEALDAAVATSATPCEHVDVTASGARFVIACGTSGAPGVRAQWVGADGVAIGAFDVASPAAVSPDAPALASDGAGHTLVAFTEVASRRARGALLTYDGPAGAGLDAGLPIEVDAGTDAASDAGSDAPSDAGSDAPSDAGNAGDDGGVDAGDAGSRSDAGHDAGRGADDGGVVDTHDASAAPAGPADDGGCGCRVPARSPTSHGAGALALAALAALASRRRRARR